MTLQGMTTREKRKNMSWENRYKPFISSMLVVKYCSKYISLNQIIAKTRIKTTTTTTIHRLV
jgi:hypothetical protein